MNTTPTELPTAQELAQQSAASWRAAFLNWKGIAERARALGDYGMALYADGEATCRQRWAMEDEQRAKNLTAEIA